MRPPLNNQIKNFLNDMAGAALVEYAVALIVVAIVGAAIFALGPSISGVIQNSAGAF